MASITTSQLQVHTNPYRQLSSLETSYSLILFRTASSELKFSSLTYSSLMNTPFIHLVCRATTDQQSEEHSTFTHGNLFWAWSLLCCGPERIRCHPGPCLELPEKDQWSHHRPSSLPQYGCSHDLSIDCLHAIANHGQFAFWLPITSTIYFHNYLPLSLEWYRSWIRSCTMKTETRSLCTLRMDQFTKLRLWFWQSALVSCKANSLNTSQIFQ